VCYRCIVIGCALLLQLLDMLYGAWMMRPLCVPDLSYCVSSWSSLTSLPGLVSHHLPSPLAVSSSSVVYYVMLISSSVLCYPPLPFLLSLLSSAPFTSHSPLAVCPPVSSTVVAHRSVVLIVCVGRRM